MFHLAILAFNYKHCGIHWCDNIIKRPFDIRREVKPKYVSASTLPDWHYRNTLEKISATFRLFQGGTSFVDLLCFCSVLCLLCLCTRLFIFALWSPPGKGLTSWLSFVVSNCKFITFPLVSWVRCGIWLYRFLIFASLHTLQQIWWQLNCH